MCGIAGALSASPVDACAIERMRDSMLHRGPDHGGTWTSADGQVSLAHRRLAIVDLSPDANQPFLSQDGRFAVTFNGEIYNFRALRNELAAEGAAFRTQSDTEVLVEAYRKWGSACLERLSGMFAFALWDTVRHVLFCARDRVGEKPFYYAVCAGRFVFASELKALRRWPGLGGDLDYCALADYLTYGFVPDPKSIFQSCRKLPPGHSLCVKLDHRGAVRLSGPYRYWDLEFAPDYSVRDWSPQVLDTLQQACREMSFADVPLGAFLSGGVDSSSVAAGLVKAGRCVNTFTVGFQEQAFDERPWARSVAGLYRTSHTERVVNASDVGPVFERILWHYDEPFNDYSYLPTYYLCREARRNITVALSGDGGDEMFAGYRKYRRLGLHQSIARLAPGCFFSAGARWVGALFGEDSGVAQHVGDPAEMLRRMVSTGLSFDALRRAARGELAAVLRHYNPREVVDPLLRKAPPAEVGVVNAMRYLDLKLTLAGGILVKVDRASMAVSLEVRPVYLHRDVVALASRIPPRLLVDRRESKKLLKRSLRSWLPEPVLYRNKMGFALPLKDWIGGELRSEFEAARANLDGLLDTAQLDSLIANRSARGLDSTSLQHSLFFLDRWCAKWV